MRKIVFVACLVFLLIIPPVSAINGDSWAVPLSEWDYRIPITITAAPSTTDIIRNIIITYQENMQNDFDDIRIYTSSGIAIDYYIKEYIASTTANVDLLLPDANMDYIYIYYGNPLALSMSSDYNTYSHSYLKDDFSGDESKWTDQTSIWTIVNGQYFKDSSGWNLNRACNLDVSNSVLSLDVDPVNDDVMIGTHVTPEISGYFVQLSYYYDMIYFYRYSNGVWGSPLKTTAYNFDSFNQVTVKCVNLDNRVDIYIDDTYITNYEYTNNVIESGTIAISPYGDGYFDNVLLLNYDPAETIFSFLSPELNGDPTPTPTPTPGLPHATLQARPVASATIAPMDDAGYYLLNTALGLNEQYNESAGTGQLNPRGVFNASTYPFTGGEYGDYASLLIFAVPFLLAWMRQNSAIIPMSFGCILGTWMLWKLPAEWQLPATGMIILSMMGILYGIYKEKY